MHEKDSEDSVYKMHEKNSEKGGRWKMGDGRWKIGGGHRHYRRLLDEFALRKLELTGVDEPALLEDCTVLSPEAGALRPLSLTLACLG